MLKLRHEGHEGKQEQQYLTAKNAKKYENNNQARLIFVFPHNNGSDIAPAGLMPFRFVPIIPALGYLGVLGGLGGSICIAFPGGLASPDRVRGKLGGYFPILLRSNPTP